MAHPRRRRGKRTSPASGGKRPLSGRLKGSSRCHFTPISPNVLLLLFKHAQSMPSVEAELVLQNPRCSFPCPGFVPSNKECPSDMLDFLVRLIHLCPHTEAPHGSVNCTGKQSRYQLSARCLICEVVSVPQKTRFSGKTTSVDFVRLGKASKSDPFGSIPLGEPCLSN
jgi:hypothetical protein